MNMEAYTKINTLPEQVEENRKALLDLSPTEIESIKTDVINIKDEQLDQNSALAEQNARLDILDSALTSGVVEADITYNGLTVGTVNEYPVVSTFTTEDNTVIDRDITGQYLILKKAGIYNGNVNVIYSAYSIGEIVTMGWEFEDTPGNWLLGGEDTKNVNDSGVPNQLNFQINSNITESVLNKNIRLFVRFDSGTITFNNISMGLFTQTAGTVDTSNFVLKEGESIQRIKGDLVASNIEINQYSRLSQIGLGEVDFMGLNETQATQLIADSLPIFSVINFGMEEFGETSLLVDALAPSFIEGRGIVTVVKLDSAWGTKFTFQPVTGNVFYYKNNDIFTFRPWRKVGGYVSNSAQTQKVNFNIARSSGAVHIELEGRAPVSNGEQFTVQVSDNWVPIFTNGFIFTGMNIDGTVPVTFGLKCIVTYDSVADLSTFTFTSYGNSADAFQWYATANGITSL